MLVSSTRNSLVFGFDGFLRAQVGKECVIGLNYTFVYILKENSLRLLTRLVNGTLVIILKASQRCYFLLATKDSIGEGK